MKIKLCQRSLMLGAVTTMILGLVALAGVGAAGITAG